MQPLRIHDTISAAGDTAYSASLLRIIKKGMNMKNLLIVEDERLIRKELRIMAERSKVPIESIIECASGEEAFEVLKSQEIDAMMTDINMDGMSGIELVKKMQDLPHKPLTFAVSGYDEFTYAVEMMHYGVRGYILKPVEQEKITEFLQKFETEIQAGEAAEKENRKLWVLQLKYYLAGNHLGPAELSALKKRFEELFNSGYQVCCLGKCASLQNDMQGLYLDQEQDGTTLILKKPQMAFLSEMLPEKKHPGISSSFESFDQLKDAYHEAFLLRKAAFCENRSVSNLQEMKHHIPEAMLTEVQKLLSEEARIRRVQTVGGGSTEELIEYWNQFFQVVRSGRMTPDEFSQVLSEFLGDLKDIYKSVVGEGEMAPLYPVFAYDGLDEYKDVFMEKILKLHEDVKKQVEYRREKKKIEEAVEYIHQHYSGELNMAIVSNHIQMNYYIFSFAFKQYTGKNFVNYLRDLRIEEAKKLLKDTDIKISEISARVGYGNPKHFMKTFKNLYGVSPSDYRNNSRIGNT